MVRQGMVLRYRIGSGSILVNSCVSLADLFIPAGENRVARTSLLTYHPPRQQHIRHPAVLPRPITLVTFVVI